MRGRRQGGRRGPWASTISAARAVRKRGVDNRACGRRAEDAWKAISGVKTLRLSFRDTVFFSLLLRVVLLQLFVKKKLNRAVGFVLGS